MKEESDVVAKIITNDINTLIEDLNNVIKAHNVLLDRIDKAIIFIQQNIRDIDYDTDEYDYLMGLLKGDKE